jgi:hypothetical protein
VIPFWIHAHAVPEISRGTGYDVTRFLLPIPGEANSLKIQALEELAQTAPQ